MESNNGKTNKMSVAGENDTSDKVSTSNKNQTKFGRHDAHKHHDTMGEIIQNQGNCAVAGKFNHNMNFVDNQFQEVNPQSDSAGAIATDKNFHSLK